MLDLTFGEQVKIILSRKGMTIKELAETIEAQTGKKMSRQNLTQRLGRDNFQEQDMRMIAEILGCPFQLSILGESIPTERTHNNIEESQEKVSTEAAPMEHERDITIGELVEIHEVLDALEENAELSQEELPQEELLYEELPQEEPLQEEPPQEEPLQEEPSQEELPQEELLENMPMEEAENAGMHEEDYGTLEYDASEQTQGVFEDATQEETAEASQEEAERSKERMEERADEEPEKKVRGWRAYLKRRKKKQELPQSTVSPVEHADDQKKESVTDVYTDDDTEAAADTGYAEEAYMRGTHAEEEIEYTDEEHADVEYMDEAHTDEEHTQESYMQATREEEDTGENDTEEDVQEAYGQEPEILEEEEDLVNGDVNPYTGREYQSNSVRMHPTRIGYVQVYDRSNHAWTDMTEWAFLGYQERKKMLLGKDYDPPIYLD